MKSISQLAFVIFTFILSSFSLAQEIDAGYAYFQSGRFEEAAAAWETTLAKLSADHSPAAYLDTSIQLAAAYQSLGRLQRALEVLQKAESIAAKLHDSVSYANVLSQLSDIYWAMRDLTSEDLRQLLGSSLDSASPTGVMEKAQQYLKQAEEMIRKADTNSEARLVLANILNKQGNLFVTQKKYERALESYEESERLAEKSGDTVLTVKSSLNRLQALIESGETDSIEKESTVKAILQRVERLPDSHDKAFTLIRLASLAQSSLSLHSSDNYAYETLRQALAVAEKLQDNLAIAYAKGDLAQLFAEERRFDEAINLTREAIFHSPSSAAKIFVGNQPELLFRWEWQLGKYLKAQKRTKEARAAYERANRQLQTARGIYRYGSEAVYKNVQTFYFEMVDLLLQQTSYEERVHGEYQLLEDVIENIESFRSAELRNYLDCPKQSPETLDNLWSQLPESTVVLYPIVLDYRMELLLVSKNGIQRTTVPVNQYELTKEVVEQLNNFRDFRSSVLNKQQRGEKKDGLLPADKLYQWFIKPIERTLEGQHIDTIVIVPHGNLILLPFATLYDGQKYLVEKYALAIIPGLGLTDFTRTGRVESVHALLVGFSKFVWSPLPYVKDELDNIENVLKERGKVDTLKGEEFTIANIEAKLREHAPYSIIHFSTHGYFNDRSEETFLLTYDYGTSLGMDKLLSMDKLGELIRNHNVGQPLDLLTLSASHTALNGERSSLELMGVALKPEARSVLASLWNVNDEATAKLMTGFYRHWQQNGFSNKAKALQQAQLELLKTSEFKHPYYWASFVLIGNWQ